ncbi:MAG: transglutaminase domain-containing protein [Gemmatimonadetes bacterium]|nr:transglutaminase domain-containing protein [Gemmatimonadota bacterium]MBK6778408.1 transglutaminase domain-containing protein [Gemmatimonadota bacterium]MBK7714848.1 transglutaminase domain-containing protein [Gemmatimonadota bacterium]MBK7924847.1 transglutaminase domain-containing protein [Gemmatimonadota bacterium]
MSRRTLAGLILLAWFGALGWLVQRQYGPGPGGAESAARWPVPPGSAFLAVRLGDRQIGLATATVDTLGDSLRVSDLTTIDLPAVDTTPRRTSARVVAMYSRGLQLLRWQADVLTEQGRVASEGTVSGDTLLTEIVTAAGATPETLQVRLRRPVILPGAITLVVASRRLPRVGDKLNLEVYDPLDHEVRLARLQVTAESLFTVADSAEFSPDLRRWAAVHSDTVRAWRLDGAEAGLPVARWIDAAGMPVRVEHPLGATLDRSAFELVQTNFRAQQRAYWDTTVAAPDLRRFGGLPARRGTLRAVASRQGGRPMHLPIPAGMAGAGQAWRADTLGRDTTMADDSLAPMPPVAEPLLADDGTLAREAAAIVGAERRPEVMARRLNDWVRRSITVREGPGQAPAAVTLARRRGSPAERISLLVGLARTAGLRARRVWGLALVEGRWQQRGWVEVWADRWLAVDPDVAAIPPGADRVRLATGGQPRLLDLAVGAGALRLQVLEDDR